MADSGGFNMGEHGDSGTEGYVMSQARKVCAARNFAPAKDSL
jgi:hypothetical protein